MSHAEGCRGRVAALDCCAKCHGATYEGVALRVDHEQIVLRQILLQLVGLILFTPIKLHHAKTKIYRYTSTLLEGSSDSSLMIS